MAKLSAMICPARGGKSTYCANWQKQTDPDGLSRVVINQDNLRLAVYGQRYYRHSEPLIHGIYNTIVRSLLMNDNLHVLMDDTHCSVYSIRNILELNQETQFIYLSTPMEVCLERAITTDQKDLLNVIPRMFKNLKELCNYHINKKIQQDILTKDCRVTSPNEYDLMMSIETIREEIKHA